MKKNFIIPFFVSILVIICLYLCIIGRERTASTPNRGSSQQCPIKPESVANLSGNAWPASVASLLNQVPQNEQTEIENILRKAQQNGIAYVVALRDIPLFKTDASLCRFVVGNGTADKVLGGAGDLPSGYRRWELGYNAIPLLDKKAKEAGFTAGYRDDILYIFFKGWQHPIIFQLSKPGSILPPRTFVDERKVIDEKVNELTRQIHEKANRIHQIKETEKTQRTVSDGL